MPRRQWLFIGAMALLIGLILAVDLNTRPAALPSHNRPHIETGERGPEETGTDNRPTETFWQRTTTDPIALYTLMLAVFTAALVGVSAVQIRYLIRADMTARTTADAAKTSAEAASRHAAAATASELAIVLPIVGSVYISERLGTGRRQITTEISFRNAGRTPAFVFQASLDMVVSPTLPETPEYREVLDFSFGQVVIDRDQPWSYPGIQALRISADQYDAILTDANQLWVYGFIAYWDILGGEHRIGYSGFWGGATGGPENILVTDPTGNYIYHYYESDPAKASRVMPLWLGTRGADRAAKYTPG